MRVGENLRSTVTQVPQAALAPSTARAALAPGVWSGRLATAYVALVVVLVAVLTASLLVGAGSLSDLRLRPILLVLRASRAGAAAIVGAALAVAGIVVQGLFRNPLADVSLIGTSAGAMLGGNASLLAAQYVLVRHGIRGVPPDLVLPIGCLAGALISLVLLVAFVRRSVDVLSLILAGFLFSSLFLSLGSLVTSMAEERWELGRAIVSLTLGGVASSGPLQLALAAPLVSSGICASWFWAKPLDILLSGDDEATSLGVDVPQVRRYCILWVSVLTAGAVALGGNIAFVGLLIPHSLRPVLGVNHRRLIPIAAIAGGAFVGACDLLARVLPSRGEVPLGVITGLVGAPAFLALLSRTQRDIPR
jgi:ABC-type Fe3+-siderophore transport system permease subunit